MSLLLRLNSFKIYNIFILFIFSVVVNNKLPLLISSSFYCIFYLFIIYFAIFHYSKLLFFIYFIYGLLLDIFLLNEIGPHLLVLLSFLFFLNYFLKFLYNQSSNKIYLFIISIQIIMIFTLMLISYLFFDISFNFMNYFQMVLQTLILSYPVFLFFGKIDQFN